ncbi:hypothetical protein GCM10007049_16510 [Echinicola pacifica]|uniref:Uncharacterized protein n=1 Tax=Echinicola pacifica TaxID=346377 RepID=A0A918PVK7_9BACT|nr:tail fiber protein [Echinicola pacifica]GGZ24803.1 hypothetical protein GCM10007049_16510 [Echinicola pacifica]
MKLLIITSLLTVISLPSFAQWTDKGSSIITTDNVGINVATPDMPLSVHSDTKYISRFHSLSTDTMTGIRIGRHNSYVDLVTLPTGFGIGAGMEGPTLPLGAQDEKYISIFSHYITKNVGIGTTNPSARLEVKSAPNENSDIHINTSSTANASVIRFMNANENKWGFISNYPINSGSFIFYNYSNKSQVFTINTSNQIGIGTTSMGSHKLAVHGSIGAREVKVESSSWSDFVFNDNYSLPSLQEVELFIIQHKHLPDVPSEKEVIENGIELGKMDATLLQKIEELTLYVIDLNKKVQLLEIENKLLQKELIGISSKVE